MAKMKKDIDQEGENGYAQIRETEHYYLSEMSQLLICKYKKLCEEILSVFESGETYKSNGQLLNEIKTLPMAYLMNHYPFEYFEWEGLSFPAESDIPKQLVEYEEEMVEYEMLLDEYSDVMSDVSEDGDEIKALMAGYKVRMDEVPKLVDEYLECYDPHSYEFVRINYYYHALDELSGSIKQQDAETIAELEAYLAHYAQHKGFDMWVLDRILEEHLAKDERLQWLEGVRDRCLQDKGTMYDYGGIYEPPLYLKYRDLWVFELSKQYLITKDTDRLVEMEQRVREHDYICRLKELSEALRVLPKSAIKLFITRDEQSDVVVKIDIKLELEGHEAYQTTVMEYIKKTSGRVAKRKPKDKESASPGESGKGANKKPKKKSASQMEIRYPGLDETTRTLNSDDLKEFYYILEDIFPSKTVVRNHKLDKASVQRINSFMRAVLPVENPDKTYFVKYNKDTNICEFDPDLIPDVSSKTRSGDR
jgi:hypothetical protein